MGWVVLTGYMGSGKSTLGPRLAERLGRPFLDSDAEIEAQAELDIPRIFATKGELWFRRTEERVIREIVASEPAGVLSIGGGAMERDRTRDLLGRTAHVAWLKVDPQTLWGRVADSDRPLATSEGRFIRRYEERIPNYEAGAHVTIDADRPLDDVLASLVDWATTATAEA